MASAEERAPRSQRAKNLISYLTGATDPTFARLEGVDCSGPFDKLDIVVTPELPQDRAVPIQHEEPIRVLFWPTDENAPSIFSRREDFPIDEVHTSYETTGDGRCLCIWEENWADLKRGLTAHALTERIRDWFARTARGELHQEGQAPEPLLPSTANTLVLPAGAPPETCYVQRLIEGDGRYTILLDAEQPTGDTFVPFSLFQRGIEPQVHGALRGRPANLAELQALLEPMGADVAQELGDWALAQLNGEDKMAVLLFTIPKKSKADGDVERWDVLAFTPHVKLHELSVSLGRAERDPDGKLGAVLGGAAPDLAAVKLNGWRVVQRLDRRTARIYAGNPAKADAKLVGVGAGAIGSTVMANAARAGVGTWTVIDDDVLLPHNLVRQAQSNPMVGWAKAETQRSLLDSVLAEEGCAGIVANVLEPGEQDKALGEAFAGADLVVDFSASPAVLGYLADAETVQRAASFFFNPEGSDLVVLAENGERTLRIDEIEAQYFLAAGSQRRLVKHLSGARVDLLRYANACQDLTQPLPPWQVQALSGIAAGQLIALLADRDQSWAGLWRLSPQSGGVSPLLLSLSQVSRYAFAEFRVSVSHAAVQTMRMLREAAAPDETGGVLLGSYDLSRSVLHILDALPAPPDSRQSPTYFERGAKDLKPQVDGVNLRSAGAIHYVGEWHSHPKGAAARPSGHDEKVFAHLHGHLDATGAPYVMTICGEVETWFRAGWHGRTTSEGVVSHEEI